METSKTSTAVAQPYSRRMNEVHQVKKWQKEVFRALEGTAEVKLRIGKCIKRIVASRKSYGFAHAQLYNVTSRYWKYQLKTKDLENLVDTNLIDFEIVDIPKDPFYKYINEATAALSLIDFSAEVEMRRLNYGANQFVYTLENLPQKKQELEEVMAYALDCADKERLRKSDYDRLVNEDKSPFSWLCCNSKQLPRYKSLQWHQTMAKAQHQEATKLTDEAIVLVNDKIKRIQNEAKKEFLLLHKHFLLTEIQQHCKALEYLTLAFKYMTACDQLEAENNPEEMEGGEDDQQTVVSYGGVSEDMLWRNELPKDYYDDEQDQTTVNDSVWTRDPRESIRSRCQEQQVKNKQSATRRDDITSNLHGVPSIIKNKSEQRVYSRDGTKSPPVRKRSTNQASSSSDQKVDTAINLLQSKPYLQKYAEKAIEYDDLINMSIDTFLESVSGDVPDERAKSSGGSIKRSPTEDHNKET